MLARVCLTLALCLMATVSTSPFCAGALEAQSHAAPMMPPPGGTPDHKEPPNGAWCDRSAAAEHHCECHNACVHNEDGSISKQEDHAKCRANCYVKHCQCPWDNCDVPPAPRSRP